MARLAAGRSERLHQSVARQLGTAILAGQYLPGHSLEGEIGQSAAMGVSRTAYREAMRILVAKGLIESRPKVGTRVTERAKWNLLDPDILQWMFSGEPDENFVRDLFELRGVIEPAAARWAALRRTDEQLGRMSACLSQMGSLGLAKDEGQQADREFHRLIIAASHNEAMIALGRSIGAAVQWTTYFKQQVTPEPRDPLPEHEAVYRAIKDRNEAGASEAMQHLLHMAYEDMKPAKT